MNTCNPSYLTVSGTPYEQGIQIGKALSPQITENIQAVKELSHAVQKNPDYQHFIRQNLSYLESRFPELVAEMKGIAEGSALPYEEIIELNIPSYFMTDQFAPECSMILARGTATEDGKTYVIKNRDMRSPVSQVLLHRIYPDGLHISEVTGIGTVTYPASGLNNFGLGVTTTGFWSSKVSPDLQRSGNSQIFLNIHDLLRTCRNVDEAVARLHQTPVMNGLNLIIADEQKACAAEMTASTIVLEWDEGNGILFRTNHYVSPKLSHFNPDTKEYPSTFKRRERIQEMLAPIIGHIRFQDLLRIMSDHKDGINGICRHPQKGFPAQTMSSTLFILEDQEIWTTLQNPCLAIPHTELKEVSQ